MRKDRTDKDSQALEDFHERYSKGYKKLKEEERKMTLTEKLNEFLEKQKELKGRGCNKISEVIAGWKDVKVAYDNRMELIDFEEDLKNFCDVLLALPRIEDVNVDFNSVEDGKYYINNGQLIGLFNLLQTVKENGGVRLEKSTFEANIMRNEFYEAIHDAQLRILEICKDDIYYERYWSDPELSIRLYKENWDKFVEFEKSESRKPNALVIDIDENYTVKKATDARLKEIINNKKYDKTLIVKAKKELHKRRVNKAKDNLKEVGKFFSYHKIAISLATILGTLALGGLHHLGQMISKDYKQTANIIAMEQNIENNTDFSKFTASAILATEHDGQKCVEVYGHAVKDGVPGFCSVSYVVDEDSWNDIYKYSKIEFEYGRDGQVVDASNSCRVSEAFGEAKARRAQWDYMEELRNVTKSSDPIAVTYLSNAIEGVDYNIPEDSEK